MNVVAINKKYQSTVNRFITWNNKHDQAVNEENEKKAEKTYDKAYELFHLLPKREQMNIMKSGITGYYF